MSSGITKITFGRAVLEVFASFASFASFVHEVRLNRVESSKSGKADRCVTFILEKNRWVTEKY